LPRRFVTAVVVSAAVVVSTVVATVGFRVDAGVCITITADAAGGDARNGRRRCIATVNQVAQLRKGKQKKGIKSECLVAKARED
jgi:hypothetical protein